MRAVPPVRLLLPIQPPISGVALPWFRELGLGIWSRVLPWFRELVTCADVRAVDLVDLVDCQKNGVSPFRFTSGSAQFLSICGNRFPAVPGDQFTGCREGGNTGLFGMKSRFPGKT